MGECDLLREAELQIRMKKLYSHDESIHIPYVIEEWCSSEVLVMEFVEGLTLSHFSQVASQESRNTAGRAIMTMALSSARHGLFNSDPNPGNYLSEYSFNSGLRKF